MSVKIYALHKPYGYISQFKGDNHKKKYLGELYPFPEGTMAIGRLDEDSEGLLILTSSGAMSELVRSNKLEKEYHAQVDGLISELALEQLRTGVEIGVEGTRYTTKPCQASRLSAEIVYPVRSKKIRDERHGPTSWIKIIVTEGKYRQVRKMTAAVGFPTLRLIRVRIGEVYLAGLGSGEAKELIDVKI